MPRKPVKSSLLADSLSNQLSEIVHSASAQVQTVSEELLDYIQERPLAALVVGFGNGANSTTGIS